MIRSLTPARLLALPALLLLTALPLAAQSGGPAPLTGPSAMGIGRGLLGMAALIAIAWVFSARRAHVNWKVVGIGLAFQLVLALGFYGESLPAAKLWGYVAIWTALVLYSAEGLWQNRRAAA